MTSLTQRYGLLTLLTLGLMTSLLVFGGCDQIAVMDKEVGSTHQFEATSSENYGSQYRKLPAAMRFKLNLRAEGSFKPGEIVQISVKALSNLPTKQAELKLILPEVAALQESKGQGRAVLSRSKPIPTHGSWNRDLGQGQSFQRKVALQIEQPGYYQVIASAVAEAEEVETDDGRRVKNSSTRDIWLWIDEEGGKVTEEFDRSLFPEDIREQPGPLTLKSELPKIGVSSSSEGKTTASNSSSSTTLYVDYINQTTGTPEPLEGARVSYSVRDWRGIERHSGTNVIGSDGEVSIPCYLQDPRGSATYSGTIHVQDNYRLRVYHPQTGSDVTGYFSGNSETDCGQQIPVRASYKMSHVFAQMDKTIEESRSFFQEERGKMHVHLEWDVDNSFYCPEQGPFIDPWCSDGGGDTVVIMDSPDPSGDTHIGGTFGDFVIAHEYGHAMHEKALGGNEGSGECPSPHYIGGSYNLQCAYSEGFANYHAEAVGFPYFNFEETYADNSDDGSIIEGAVAAFFFDLTDAANESHDNADYPGSYVADVIRTCEVDGSRANGIDHLIACFQREIPSYSGYFETRGNRPSSYDESASEPSGWNRTDIVKLWRENLYREDYDGSPPPPSLTVNLSGPTYLDEGEHGTWTSSPHGGDGSYDYSWEVRQNSSDPWYNVCGNSSSCTWGIDQISQSLSARIRVTVSSGNNSSTSSMSFVVNNNGGGGGCNDVTTNRICL